MDAVTSKTPLTPALAAVAARTLRDAGFAVAGAPALLLACGNSLREDDGVGLRIAEAAEKLFPASRLRIVAAQQFMPEMAADLAATDLVIFVDACVGDDPGAIRVCPVAANADSAETHRLDPPALLAMAGSLCGHTPARAFALTVGAGRLGYGTEISGPLRQAVPRACRLVTNLLMAFSPHQA
jgi:hydrogenase maturation protease